jgi:hypothetical protein
LFESFVSSDWKALRACLEEEERESSRALGMGTWRNVQLVYFHLLCCVGGANIWFGAFLMPPIPTVLVHSFLFLLAYVIALIQNHKHMCTYLNNKIN